METKYLICLDIHLKGEAGEKVERIRRRAVDRIPNQPKNTGSLFLWEQGKRSRLVGGERGLLNRIVAKRAPGRLIEVDGLYKGGVNAAVVVSSEELDELGKNPTFALQKVVRLLE